MNFQLIENKDIDLYKWDSCILKSINGLPYAYSWYLNIVSDKWKAIILNDYEAVMPVMEERILSVIPYIRNDKLIPQLGIFTTKLLSKEVKEKFFEILVKKYAWTDLSLNKYSTLTNSDFNHKIKERYELDLINTYSRIAEKYSNDLKQKLNYAAENKITVVKGLMPNDLVRLINKKYFIVNKSFKVSLRILASTSIRYRIGQIYGAFTRQNNICAAILFLKSNKKAIMLVTAFTDEALEYNAIESMVDHYLKIHSENDLTFVFENVGHRRMFIDCSGFGTHKMNYQALHQKGSFLKL